MADNQPASADDLADESMSQPRISVVIPTYDRPGLVARAIDSAAQQTLPPHEIVVVDDGSTRLGSETVCAERGVRWLSQENLGLTAARNRGVETVSGTWVALLDDDDVLLDDHLERIAAAIDATGGAAALYFDDTRIPGAPSLWTQSGFDIEDDHVLVPDATDWVMRPLQPMSMQSSVFRRDLYRASGGQLDRDRLPTREDTEFFFRLGLGHPACAVAGEGAIWTSDAPAGSRVTHRLDRRSPEYLTSTVLMYRRIAQLAAGRSDVRRELRARRAAAHRKLARLEWESGSLLRSARDAALGAVLDAPEFARRAAEHAKSAALKRKSRGGGAPNGPSRPVS